jgi:transcriptional regulator with XRE-family HTH domain
MAVPDHPHGGDDRTVAVNFFIAEMKRLRQRDGLTQGQLADLVPCSESTVGMIETGKRAPKDDFAKRIDEIFGTDGMFLRLLEHLIEEESTPKWFRHWADDIEPRAQSIRSFEPNLIPGLLQTEAYARALLQDDAKVARRLERQATLDRLDSFVAVVDEQVLLRPVGGPNVMAEQVARLIEDDRAAVHIVPLSIGVYPGVNGPLVLAVVDGAEVGMVAGQLRGRVTRAPEDISVIRRVWEGVRSVAESRNRSLSILKEAHERWIASGASPAVAERLETIA